MEDTRPTDLRVESNYFMSTLLFPYRRYGCTKSCNCSPKFPVTTSEVSVLAPQRAGVFRRFPVTYFQRDLRHYILNIHKPKTRMLGFIFLNKSLEPFNSNISPDSNIVKVSPVLPTYGGWDNWLEGSLVEFRIDILRDEEVTHLPTKSRPRLLENRKTFSNCVLVILSSGRSALFVGTLKSILISSPLLKISSASSGSRASKLMTLTVGGPNAPFWKDRANKVNTNHKTKSDQSFNCILPSVEQWPPSQR